MTTDEIFAERAFHQFLTGLGSHAITWSPGDEPPDRYLAVDEQRFAVEITQIMENVDLGGTSMPDRGVNSALTSFAAEIEQQAKERGVLSGRYVVSLEPIPNMAERRQTLLERICGYLSETAGLESAGPVLLESFDKGRIAAVRRHSSLSSAISGAPGREGPRSLRAIR